MGDIGIHVIVSSITASGGDAASVRARLDMTPSEAANLIRKTFSILSEKDRMFLLSDLITFDQASARAAKEILASL